MSKFERMQDSEFHRKIRSFCKGAHEEGREQKLAEGGPAILNRSVKDNPIPRSEGGDMLKAVKTNSAMNAMRKKKGGMAEFEHMSSPSKEPHQSQFVKKEATPKKFKMGGESKRDMEKIEKKAGGGFTNAMRNRFGNNRYLAAGRNPMSMVGGPATATPKRFLPQNQETQPSGTQPSMKRGGNCHAAGGVGKIRHEEV